jgi:hypothetical protein
MSRCSHLLSLLLAGVLSVSQFACNSGPSEAPAAAPANAGHGQRAFAYTEAILKFGPRPPGSPELDAVRGYVTAELARHGWVAQPQSFEMTAPDGPRRFTNLIARYQGKESAEAVAARVPEAILCAHIDSKLMPGDEFLGADDAASAVAAIVEIARVLATEDPARAAKLELVFFDGEESFGPNINETDGLYGSKFYAQQWTTRGAMPRFGILLDMIGHKNLRIRIPSDTPAHLRDALMAAAKHQGALDHFGSSDFPIVDDHVPLNQAGIPTIDIIGDFPRMAWWHTPADNLTIIDPQSLEISIGTTLEMLRNLLR